MGRSSAAHESGPAPSPQGHQQRAKRWHYQVCREAKQSAGLQLNPLKRAEPLFAQAAPGGQSPLLLHSARPARDDASLAGDESWVAQLELEAAGRAEPSQAERASSARLLLAFLLCFSLRRNLRNIVGHPSQPARDCQDIKVVHGLRTLAMIWIIFGHTIGLVSPEMMSKFGGRQLLARSGPAGWQQQRQGQRQRVGQSDCEP